MEVRKQKTLKDFPKFTVTAIRGGATSAEGYISFELDGSFDDCIEIHPHWFWLVFGEGDYFCAVPKSLDQETKTATLTFKAKEEPNVIGQSLAYLSPYWQGYHVGMVLDPNWGWKRMQFQGTDAVAQDYESNEVSVVNGREIRIWTKLEPLEVRRGQSRHYPADDQTSPPNPEIRRISSGWGHEHCELCNAHINAGQLGYCDPWERWMCEKCYERYVVQRDLAFVDEL